MQNPIELPDAFRIKHCTLGELVDGFNLETRCACGRIAFSSVRLLAKEHGNATTIGAIVPRLRCHTCRATPEMVYLIAQDIHREPCGGPLPCWSLVLQKHADA